MNEHLPVPPEGGPHATGPAASDARRSAPRGLRRALWAALVLVAVAAFAIWRQSDASDQGRAAEAVPQAGAQPAVAVRTRAATRERFERTARYNGELDADSVQIAARVSGLLQEVAVRIGDRVRRDEVLARVDTAQLSAQLAEAQAAQKGAAANAQRVEAELSLARAELERTEPLLADQLVSAQEVDALKARVASLGAQGAAAAADAEQARAREQRLRQQIRDARLLAPFDGAVAERHLDAGAVVAVGTPVLRVVREGPLRVRFRVPERDLGRLQPGQPLSLSTQATGGRRFEGRVERVAAAVSREDRAAEVEGVLTQRDDALRPGMYAQIVLRFGVIDDAVTVPGQALVERPDDAGVLRTGVFAVEDRRARFVPVRVLGRSGERVAVEGLPEGAAVVIVGQQRVRDGARVNLVEGES